MKRDTHLETTLVAKYVVMAPLLDERARRLWAALRKARQRPYLLYCIGVITTFVVEYSTFSNFAIIARERTQITALLLVFLFMPREGPVDVAAPTVRPQGVPAVIPTDQ